MNRIETLVSKFEFHISLPWQSQLSSEERTIFLVYPKDDERRLRAMGDLFAQCARKHEHDWRHFSLDHCFGKWMSQQEYATSYYEYPHDLNPKLDSDFVSYLAHLISHELDQLGDSSILALSGISTLLGFAHLSSVLSQVQSPVPGRLLVFFPGSHEKNHYRLLDGRESWDYLAFPITLNEATTL